MRITERALKKLMDLCPDTSAVRVSVLAGGCSGLRFKMDIEERVALAGDTVLMDYPLDVVADKRSALFLKDVVLDHSDGLNGKGFEWVNPSAKRTCGCGESFSV